MNEEQPKDTALSASTELQIQKVVEDRLRNLPASTYELIETMVEKRVAKVEKMYRWIGIITFAALTIVSVGFFKLTGQNAVQKVSDTIASSKLGEKLKEIEQAHTTSLSGRDGITKAHSESVQTAATLGEMLKTLEKSDNIVRYSENGNLILDFTGGSLILRNKEDMSKTVSLYLDKDGFLVISGKGGSFYPTAAKYLQLE